MALLFALANAPTAAEVGRSCLTSAGTVTIESWSAPLTAHLTDGRPVRLADLQPAGGFTTALPVGRAALFVRPEPDRWGRVIGDLVPEATGEGLRASLVADGLAFIEPAVMPDACDAGLFKLERAAARLAVGLWASALILDAHQPGLSDHTGQTVFVVGTVASVGVTRRTVYLNFGDDYRTDFTVMIDKDEMADWTLHPTSLEGVSVRVRGVLEAWNGGLIRVEHPAQIERGRFRAR